MSRSNVTAIWVTVASVTRLSGVFTEPGTAVETM